MGVLGCQPAEESSPRVVLQPAAESAAALLSLYHEYDEEWLVLSPLSATYRGDSRYNDRWYPYDPLSDDYAERTYDLHRRYLERLQAIDPSGLGEQDRLNYEIFKFDRENALERHEKGYNAFAALTPVNQFFGIAQTLVILGSGATAQPFATPEDYDNWISRSAGFAAYVDLAIAKMREGVERGVVQPRVIMEKSLPQLAAQVVADPETSDFWRPVANMPNAFTDEERDRISAAYRQHIREVLVPAYAKLHDYVRDEYMKHVRDTVGQNAVPGGAEYYAFLVRESTTTDMTPEEIHDLGKREAARLYAEMGRVREQVGFEGDMQTFFDFLKTDSQFFFTEEQALLDAYEALRHKVNPALDSLFDIRPKADYVIMAVETFRAASMAAAQYYRGTPDGSRPGIFYVNTYDLASRQKWMMAAVSLHEASPGHHFQGSIAQELDMPAFRRFGSYTAYSEGWGLYAETLGEELGLYHDPYQYLGSLFTDIWRANRLVVDTGMHALGWSRGDAIDWMRSNSPISDADVVAEVERYIAIPSQALAYKVGQLKLLELRARAEAALGEAFDIRGFHNQVLTSGPLPLRVLEAKIDRWIATRRR
jgi:uncharacterized protein (DUF885 family)